VWHHGDVPALVSTGTTLNPNAHDHETTDETSTSARRNVTALCRGRRCRCDVFRTLDEGWHVAPRARRIPTMSVLALTALAALWLPVQSFYLPGVAPQDYQKARLQMPCRPGVFAARWQTGHRLTPRCRAGGANPEPEDEQTQLFKNSAALRVLLVTILPTAADHVLSREPGRGVEGRPHCQLEVPGARLQQLCISIPRVCGFDRR
jgi:hypothetical protein